MSTPSMNDPARVTRRSTTGSRSVRFAAEDTGASTSSPPPNTTTPARRSTTDDYVPGGDADYERQTRRTVARVQDLYRVQRAARHPERPQPAQTRDELMASLRMTPRTTPAATRVREAPVGETRDERPTEERPAAERREERATETRARSDAQPAAQSSDHESGSTGSRWCRFL